MNMRILIVLGAVAFFLHAPPSEARTWHVNPEGTGDAPTIQAALDSTANGDTVLVAPGTYVERLTLPGLTLVLMSEAGAEATTITAKGVSPAGRVVTFGVGYHTGTVIEGFTITGGMATIGTSLETWGGGIRCAGDDIVIRRNIIRDNVAISMGGLYYITGSGILLEDNVIEGNLCYGSSGGVQINPPPGGVSSSSVVRGNRIIGNHAMNGGGLSIYGDVLLVDNVISENACDIPGSIPNAMGGGVLCGHGVRLERNTITENVCPDGEGGGIYIEEISYIGPVTLTGNVIAGNEARLGGGILIDTYDWYENLVRIESCTIVGNTAQSGSGIYAWTAPVPSVMTNCIVAMNQGSPAIRCPTIGPAEQLSITCCDVWGTGVRYGGGCGDLTGVNGNIAEDPRFCGYETADYTLRADSPCLEGYGCGLIGALGEGCSATAVESVTWGAVRSRFR